MSALSSIRKQRNLSTTFVSQLVQLPINDYQVYEDDKTGNALKENPKLLAQLAKLFGVRETDLLENQPDTPVLAKDHLSANDQTAMAALIAFHNKK